jgi:hypothetical protein
MTDALEKLFHDLRVRTLGEIVPPGTPRVRATVRDRRGLAVLGTGVAVAAVLAGAAVLRPVDDGGLIPSGSGEASPSEAAPSSGPPVMPEPSGPLYDNTQAAGELLADRDKTPTSINATSGVVSPSYEDDMNDMPVDTYTFHFFCVGAGTVHVVVKQGDSGNTVLGQGTAACAAQDPAPLRLTIHQPTYGYLRIFASGDAQSNGRAGFAFEFLSATGKTTFGPSGPPMTLSTSAGPSSIDTMPTGPSPSS